ncbi:acyltransferase [Siphonobacter sp. SORGH_AS_0500]|uniref:acyltransferase family protein n=1 Tax=Siphonobacter sp. SORGH_AS_0500 TaxID=1864824 RepID=UPI000CC90192|nr:acyltransferase family protein [Siphonobacter sp. SORGH_AS_0500]PKK37608.1 acyltransferase [Siphonobacter sp. SORGH_AS_0500]
MKSIRRYDLDWLRVLAFLLLIFFHTGMFFNYWGWHVKNNVQTHWVEYPMMFTSAWRMALLFMISGMGVYWALGQRSAGSFLGERTKRIFIPLVFGMFFIIPPQIFFERISNGATYSFLEFYPSTFEFLPYPKGNFSWHHLWYLAYLFCYSVIGLPILLLLRKPGGQQLTARLAQVFSNPLWLLLIPTVWHWLADFWWDERFPTTNNLVRDWRQHWHYFSLFLTGYVFCTQQQFWDTLARYRFLTLGLVCVCTTILYTFFWIDSIPKEGAAWAGYEFFRTFNAWACLLAIFGNGYRYLRFNNRFLAYANEAVYPFYILHQTITVSAGYYLAPLPMAWPLKFLLLVGITFGGCWLLYELIIRRFQLTRLLFGMKTHIRQ